MKIRIVFYLLSFCLPQIFAAELRVPSSVIQIRSEVILKWQALSERRL